MRPRGPSSAGAESAGTSRPSGSSASTCSSASAPAAVGTCSGPQRLVTQSHGTVLYELDGKPALSLLRDHLDAEIADAGGDVDGVTVAFPLAVRDLDEREVVRTVWSVNAVTDSLRCGGDVPQGAVAQLLQGSPDRLVDAASQAARRATTGADELAIAISCVGRLAVLGDRIGEETDAAREALPRRGPDDRLLLVRELRPGDRRQ